MPSLIQQISLALTSESAAFMAVFAAVFVLVLSVGLLINRHRPAIERLPVADLPAGGLSLRERRRQSVWISMLKPFQRLSTPKDQMKISALRRRLAQAGLRSPSAVAIYYGLRGMLAVIIPFIVIWYLPLVVSGMAPQQLLLAGGLGGLIGFYAPIFFVSQRVKERRNRIRIAFPDALDMLLVCVEAGQSLSAAIERVGRELAGAHPSLGDEFRIVALELGAGVSREEALRGLADRTGVDEVSALVTLILQSEALGASVAESLRVYAKEMRTKRLLRAEEKAMKLPVKLTLPLLLFLLPCTVITVAAPALIRMVRFLGPLLQDRTF